MTILKELFALVFRGKNLYRTRTARREEVIFAKIRLIVFSTVVVSTGNDFSGFSQASWSAMSTS